MLQIFFIGFTAGCFMGFVFEQFQRKYVLASGRTHQKERGNDKMTAVVPANQSTYKLVLIINAELKMGDGKMLAQCAHAAVGSYETYYKTHKSNFEIWEQQGKQTSIYKVSDTSSLKALYRSADNINLMTCLVKDAGRTQIAAGSSTVLAIGPLEESLLDPITQHLVSF